MSDKELTKSERIKMIVRALEACGEEATTEAVAAQYRRETGKDLEKKEDECSS